MIKNSPVYKCQKPLTHWSEHSTFYRLVITNRTFLYVNGCHGFVIQGFQEEKIDKHRDTYIPTRIDALQCLPWKPW